MYDACRFYKAWHPSEASPWCVAFIPQHLQVGTAVGSLCKHLHMFHVYIDTAYRYNVYLPEIYQMYYPPGECWTGNITNMTVNMQS